MVNDTFLQNKRCSYSNEQSDKNYHFHNYNSMTEKGISMYKNEKIYILATD